MHRFQQFVIGELVPELANVEGAITKKQYDELAMVRSFVGEKFLWLHLGTEVGAFPRTVSLAVYKAYLEPFFRSLADPSAVGEYAAHSRESKAMRKSFPPFAQQLFDSALRIVFDAKLNLEATVFLAQQCVFKKPANLIGLFQTHLLLRDHVWRNHAVRWFIRALNFSTDEFWKSLWKQDCTPEQVTQYYADPDPEPSKAVMYAGYLGIYRYGAQVMQLNESVQDDSVLDSTDVSKLLSRIREMQSWTVNLSSGQVSTRFEAVRQGLSEALRRQSETDDLAEATVAEIENSINEALEYIGIPQLALKSA